MGWSGHHSEHEYADSFLVEEQFIIAHRQTFAKWNVGKNLFLSWGIVKLWLSVCLRSILRATTAHVPGYESVVFFEWTVGSDCCADRCIWGLLRFDVLIWLITTWCGGDVSLLLLTSITGLWRWALSYRSLAVIDLRGSVLDSVNKIWLVPLKVRRSEPILVCS